MTTPQRLRTSQSQLAVIDIQDKLLSKIPTAVELVSNSAFLLDAARLLEIPILATEQYPRGLGPTTAEIARRLPAAIPSKTAFSCCGAGGFMDSLKASGRQQVVLSGMETHVCVLHTALDLLEAGFQVFLPVDALASRTRLDHDTALRRLEQAGCILITSEMAAFEWVGGASHPLFKSISKLVIERSAPLVP